MTCQRDQGSEGTIRDSGQQGCKHLTRHRTMRAQKRIHRGNRGQGLVHYNNCVGYTNTWNMSHTVIGHAILLVVSFIWFSYDDVY